MKQTESQLIHQTDLKTSESLIQFIVDMTNGIDKVQTRSDGLILRQNQPNPCNGQTRFPFELALPAKVSLKLFNQLGAMVQAVTNYGIVNLMVAEMDREPQGGLFNGLDTPTKLITLCRFKLTTFRRQ
jgi:hypothetical protein